MHPGRGASGQGCFQIVQVVRKRGIDWRKCRCGLTLRSFLPLVSPPLQLASREALALLDNTALVGEAKLPEDISRQQQQQQQVGGGGNGSNGVGGASAAAMHGIYMGQ